MARHHPERNKGHFAVSLFALGTFVARSRPSPIIDIRSVDLAAVEPNYPGRRTDLSGRGIGPGLILHTAYGLQIAPVKIGSGCTFNSQVLIGTGVKSIGNNCYFGPGCKVVGECKIGNNVLVVANSVVLTDVPDNTTIMGVPARIKLPGGRLRKMPWKTMEARKNEVRGNEASKNDAKTNLPKTSGMQTNAVKTGGVRRTAPRRTATAQPRAALWPTESKQSWNRNPSRNRSGRISARRRQSRGNADLDFAWTEEQAAFRKEVIRFAQQELNDDLIRRDEEEEFSRSHWKKCAEFGIQGLPVPQEYGGGGADILTTVCALEALGYGCRDNGFLFSLNAHMWTTEIPIMTFGSEAQKRRYLPKLISGDWIGLHAMTEPMSGSDAYSLRTRAERKGNCYVLNG